MDENKELQETTQETTKEENPILVVSRIFRTLVRSLCCK